LVTMTIVTKPLTAVKEKKEKEALESLVTIDNNDTNLGEGKDEPDLNLGYVNRTSRRSPVCFTLCLLLLAMIGLMSGAYIYKAMYSRRNWCGTYRIPLPTKKIMENSLIGGNFQRNLDEEDYTIPEENFFALFNHDVPYLGPQEFRDFEFDIELDLDDENVETLELPEVFSGRYLHDFMVNLTVIIDVLGERCFIMKLDRNVIPKPRNILDYLNKERQGAYDLDYEVIKQSFVINGETLKMFDSSYGHFIPDACYKKDTYQLVEFTETLIEKREVGSSRGLFGEFVGSKLIKYNIVNFNQIDI